jgi:hypothetical protein
MGKVAQRRLVIRGHMLKVTVKDGNLQLVGVRSYLSRQSFVLDDPLAFSEQEDEHEAFELFCLAIAVTGDINPGLGRIYALILRCVQVEQ